MGLRDFARFVADVSIIVLLGIVYVAGLAVITLLAPVIRPGRDLGLFSDGERERPLTQG